MNKRYITLETGIDYGVRDNVTGDSLFEQDITDKLNELSSELAIYKSKYLALKEAHFTRMGGFTMERDGRGRYNICSENVIPKNSAVIRIASPDVVWNNLVADIFKDILTEEVK